MIYAGSLPALGIAWAMSDAEAGLVQSVFNFAYALSLVAAGWLSDRLGARRVFLWSSACTALAGIMVAGLARSFESGLVLFALFGLFHGGTYTPSIMLIAQGVPSARRGLAIGMLLAGASLGYAGSIAIASAATAFASYREAFVVCAIAPAAAFLFAKTGTRGRPNLIVRRHASVDLPKGQSDRHASILLTLGYTAHCWELLGMWAWMPAFLLSALAASSAAGQLVLGVWIGIAIHLSGCLSAFTMGHASDRFGRRTVLVLLGILGAASSLAIGWLEQAPAALLLAFAALYGFTALGDSPVLSTAMTETVAPRSLGSALALRSILGFGAGGLSPLVFGAVRDATPPDFGWIAAFSVLGAGGLAAALCAMLLRGRRRRSSAFTGRREGELTCGED
ncbi:MAG: MFS transporter [Rhodospirillaceae bacterium]|nr:MFS transporter [Rhodospirillaceae bacterium]